jgi:hypothetical protein
MTVRGAVVVAMCRHAFSFYFDLRSARLFSHTPLLDGRQHAPVIPLTLPPAAATISKEAEFTTFRGSVERCKRSFYGR